jgi:hypothetical protein
MIGTFDVHWHPHGRRVSYERVRRMTRRHDDARAHRLFAEVVVNDLLLDKLHDVSAEEANHGQVHPCIHQTERIARSDNAVKNWQLLESPTNDLNLGMGAELPAQHLAKLPSSIYKNQSHKRHSLHVAIVASLSRSYNILFTARTSSLCAEV